MTIEEIKQFIEENKDKEEVKNYIGGLTLTPDRVSQFLENEDGKRLLQPKLDSHFTKGLDTWKGNNLSKLIDEEIKKRFPEKDQKDIELENIKAQLEAIQKEAQLKELTNKALLLADEKKLPKDLIKYFVGSDEETTTKNLEVLESIFDKHINEGVEARMKQGNNHIPPKGDPKGDVDISKMSMAEYAKYYEERNK